MSHLPDDRSHVDTEQRHAESFDLHTRSIASCVDLMVRDQDAVRHALAGAGPALTAFLHDAESRFNRGGRIVYLGAGTSGRLGVLDASEAPPTFQVPPGRVIGIIAGGDAALRRSSEGLEDDPRGAADALHEIDLAASDIFIGIASGGTTPYVRGALGLAKGHAPECLTAFITCTPIQADPDVDHVIHLDTGPELLTGSTRLKAGTATKAMLNMISTILMIRSGRVYENLMVDLRATNDKLRDRAARIVSQLTGVERTDAFALLDRAEGEVKTAVVMKLCELDLPAARERLERVGGRLDRALEPSE